MRTSDVKIKYQTKICPLFNYHLTQMRFLPHREVTLVAFAQRPSDAVSTLNVTSKATPRIESSNAKFARRNLLEGKVLRRSRELPPWRKTSNIKHFLRDTLQRHATLHGQTPTKVHKTLPRASRACISCVKSKQRCSGLQPCDRCNRKGWHCQFPKGSKEAQLQELNSLSSFHEAEPTREANPSGISNHDTSNSSGGRQSEMFNAWGLSPISSNQAELAFAGTPENGGLASIFDSCLLWPLDDPSEQYPMSSFDPTGLSMSSGMAEAANQPIDTACVVDTPGGHPVQANEPSLSSNGQSDAYMWEDKLTQEDRDILISEDYRHVPKPSIASYQQMCAHYAETRELSPKPILPALYPLDILHVCTQLYFEHLHPTFPILHRGSFQPRSSSWLLYIAVAALGSQYSRLAGRNAIFRGLMTAIRMCLLQKVCPGQLLAAFRFIFTVLSTYQFS